MYKTIIRPFLFKVSPEKIHHITFNILRWITPFFGWLFRLLFDVKNKKLERNLFGLTFKNPVGLAAGFDKNAALFNELSDLGFGFIEIGTVTPVPQEGNPQPRLFRLPKDHALINRMGFNNEGVDAAVERLKYRRRTNQIIGGNIGKNKITPNENAVVDYLICFTKLFDYVDYFVINVSSPNTPNLRELQDKEPLTNLLQTLMNENNKKDSPKPILLKIAPDMTNSQLDDIIDLVKETKIAGVIASNTTINRDGLQTSNEEIQEIGAGGLSGKPVKNRSTEVIRYLSTKSNKSFAIIGVGGIHSEDDALEKLESGADLIQIFTGFIYEGPGLIKRINKKILAQ